MLSRDVYRLGQLFDFFRMLSFFFTTVGYYVCTMVLIFPLSFCVPYMKFWNYLDCDLWNFPFYADDCSYCLHFLVRKGVPGNSWLNYQVYLIELHRKDLLLIWFFIFLHILVNFFIINKLIMVIVFFLTGQLYIIILVYPKSSRLKLFRHYLD